MLEKLHDREMTATHRSKRVAVQGAKRFVPLDPYVTLWDKRLGIGVWRESLDGVVCDGDDALDDHFSTVDGISGRMLAQILFMNKTYLRETTSPLAIGLPE